MFFKIRLWYKRKNDDNFKISLSQIFLHASSNCYYPDKQSRNSNIASAANMLNIEEELCELLHENSQLKNYLKEVTFSWFINMISLKNINQYKYYRIIF